MFPRSYRNMAFSLSVRILFLFREVFKRIAPLTKLDTLKESLKLFMKHFLKPKKSISWPNINKKFEKVDKERILDERIDVAIDALSGS